MRNKELEKKIASWRRQLRKQDYLTDGVIEELEDHLREEIEQLLDKGLSPDQAFESAVQKIGSAEDIGTDEYRVVQRDRFILTQLMRSFLKVGVRHFRRNSLTTIINFFGLTVAFTAVIFISLFVFDEFSFEQHHPDHDQIYRLSYSYQADNGIVQDRAFGSGMWVDLLKERTAHIEESFRYTALSYGYLVNPERNDAFYEEDIYWSDPNFFDFLNFPLKYGSKESQLKDLSSIILTESTSKKIFGDINPVGRTLIYRRRSREVSLKVTGVIFDPPSNSLFQPKYIAHIQAIQGIYGERYRGWIDNIPAPNPGGIFTYLKVKDPEQIEHLTATMKTIWQEAIPGRAEKMEPLVTPLASIHFNPPMKWEVDNPIDPKYLYGLVIIALFILTVALTNFVSLTTAVSSKRQKEIGLRKTFGGTRSQLKIQFMLESVMMVLASMVVTIVLSYAFMPYFNELVDKRIDLPGVMVNSSYWMPMLSMMLLVLFLTGGLPALFFSRRISRNLNATQLFRRERINSPGRSVLVIVQFTVAIILIISTTTVYRQLNMINDGFLAKNRDTVIGIRTSRMGDSLQIQRYKTEIMKVNGVVQNTLGEHLPKQSDFGRIDTRYYTSLTGEEQQYWDKFEVDGGFLETYGLKLLAGRDFRRNIESNALIVNETLVNSLGLTPNEALGITLREDSMNYVFSADDGVIVGVVEDFTYRSVREPIQPLVITASNYVEGVLSVKLSGDYTAAVSELGTLFTQIYPGRPFEYWFLDKEFERLYHQERRLGKLIPLFTGLAVVIALLGLFALASFIAELRKKEIGIRKVLGCSSYGIVKLLVSQNLKTLIPAVLIGVPVSWLAMNYWLESFTYRTSVEPWVILLAVSATTALAVITVAYQTLKAALQNPVRSIQYE